MTDAILEDDEALGLGQISDEGTRILAKELLDGCRQRRAASVQVVRACLNDPFFLAKRAGRAWAEDRYAALPAGTKPGSALPVAFDARAHLLVIGDLFEPDQRTERDREIAVINDVAQRRWDELVRGASA